jgi:G3E family GTPase
MIPVTVLTGFLGSGKTTLLARLLRSPELARTAVIVNEFGEVGIDHDLVETSDESFVQLTTGCLCCRVRSDLVLTLQDLAARRASGEIPAFERVVIETSGLADPASILQALMTDPGVAEIYGLHNVVTTVDALLGAATLQRHEQSVRQAAVADLLVLTKVDLAPSGSLVGELGRLNPGALVCEGTIAPAELLDGQVHDTVARMAQLGAHAAGRHVEGMTSISFVRDEPISAVALALFLQALAEHSGEGLLRMKGIVHVRENPAQPAVIHGVQHVFHPPQWLDAWPGDDRRTRMVFIGSRVPSARWAAALLDLLELEVAEELARRRAAE